ncbi:MAG: HAD-IA family hydrolase [Clostridiales bacterium]|nr:HAD-IA family hydrolase [Clostridiales bacterium]
MTDRKLCLIGGMGSGKSKLSRRYSALVGGEAIDTDKEFVERYGDIGAFFAEHGEQEFRKCEEQLMIEASKSDACVIATGGGAVLNRRGMNALRSTCDVVWLTAPIEVLRQRIMKSNRPLKNSLDVVMKEREPLYRKYADYIIDTSDDSLKELESALKTPRKRRYDFVLCDSDDTLLDFQKAYVWALAKTLKSFGVESDRAAIEYKLINDVLWHKLERGEIERSKLKIARAQALSKALDSSFDPYNFNDIYTSYMQKTRFTLKGATEFCDDVRATGAKLYIITNSFEEMARERLKVFDGHIDGYFVSEAVGYDKPDTKFFDAVLDGVGVEDRSRVIVLGDSETSDITGGMNSGLDTCLYDVNNARQTAADFHVSSYDEFLKLL